jgi:hypothetical protein
MSAKKATRRKAGGFFTRSTMRIARRAQACVVSMNDWRCESR